MLSKEPLGHSWTVEDQSLHLAVVAFWGHCHHTDLLPQYLHHFPKWRREHVTKELLHGWTFIHVKLLRSAQVYIGTHFRGPFNSTEIYRDYKSLPFEWEQSQCPKNGGVPWPGVFLNINPTIIRLRYSQQLKAITQRVSLRDSTPRKKSPWKKLKRQQSRLNSSLKKWKMCVPIEFTSKY